MLKNLRIGTKVGLVVALLLVMVAMVVWLSNSSLNDVKSYSTKVLSDEVLYGYKGQIKTAADAVAISFATAIKDIQNPEEKIAIIRKLNSPIVFLENKTGYFFVYDKNNVCLSLPANRSLEGKQLGDLADTNGVKFVAELTKKAIAGGGFVQYLWPKKKDADPEPKLSYSKMIPGTDWWIGTGVYIDDVKTKTAAVEKDIVQQISEFKKFGFIVLLIYGLIIVLPLVWTLVKLIINPLAEIKDVALLAAEGNFSQNIKYVSKDEVGAVADAFRELGQLQQGYASIAVKLAQGDWDQSVVAKSSEDQLGNALISLIDQQNQALIGVKQVADEVDSGSGQISDASQSLSQGATESAASLEEISSSMTQIGSQTKANAENASHANNLAAQTRNAADSGNKKMQEMMAAMEDIQGSSKQIANIIKVIDDIAFQTNLLALNAAVEAARAGRHGKGFAVVADEVRNLAGRSAKAAKETSEMIESSIGKVNVGTEIAEATEKALQEIVDSSVKVADLVGEIAAASNEQAQGIAQIGQGLEQIDKVTQQNTANAEETAAAAEELSSQARELSGLLVRFNLRDGGGQFLSKSRQNLSAGQRTPVNRAISSAGKSHNLIKPSDIVALDDDEFGRF